MSSILFITGTDTGVGKTSVSASLVCSLRSRGFSIRVMKPVETGCERDEHSELIPVDADLLREAARNEQTRSDVCCYCFSAPVAPSVAALASDTAIDTALICSQIETQSRGADLLVVEGAGGLLVPISGGYTFADLASECGARCVVVVGSRLGALNHAALTFEALRARKIPVLGYVLNELFEASADRSSSEQKTAVTAENTNRDELRAIAERYEIAELAFHPHVPGGVSARNLEATAASQAISQLSEAVIEQFALSR